MSSSKKKKRNSSRASRRGARRSDADLNGNDRDVAAATPASASASPVQPLPLPTHPSLIASSTHSHHGRLLFLTVGTTHFDLLIDSLNSSAASFVSWLLDGGFSRVVMQIGTGRIEPANVREEAIKQTQQRRQTRREKHDDGGSDSKRGSDELVVEWFRLSPDIGRYISQADLIISHAGAGSILESLRAHRPLLVVVNPTLMHNHQTEVAHALAQCKYLYFTQPTGVIQALKQGDWRRPIEAVAGNGNLAEDGKTDGENRNRSKPIDDDDHDAASADSHSTSFHRYRLRRYPSMDRHAFPHLLVQHIATFIQPPSPMKHNDHDNPSKASLLSSPLLPMILLPLLLAFVCTWLMTSMLNLV